MVWTGESIWTHFLLSSLTLSTSRAVVPSLAVRVVDRYTGGYDGGHGSDVAVPTSKALERRSRDGLREKVRYVVCYEMRRVEVQTSGVGQVINVCSVSCGRTGRYSFLACSLAGRVQCWLECMAGTHKTEASPERYHLLLAHEASSRLSG